MIVNQFLEPSQEDPDFCDVYIMSVFVCQKEVSVELPKIFVNSLAINNCKATAASYATTLVKSLHVYTFKLLAVLREDHSFFAHSSLLQLWR